MPKVKSQSQRTGPAADKTKERPVHPYSRKALKMGKQILHEKKIESSKTSQFTRTELVAEKLRWFQAHLDDRHLYTKQDVIDLVQEYRNRFSDELEQISIVHNVGSRNRHAQSQHSARESAIRMTMEEETNQFEATGIEVPDLINKKHLEEFKKWNGEQKFIQNFKLRKISSEDVKKMDSKMENMTKIKNMEEENEEICNTTSKETVDVS